MAMDPLTQWLIDQGLPPPADVGPGEPTTAPPLGPAQGGPGSFSPGQYGGYNPYLYSFNPSAPMVGQMPTSPVFGTPPQNTMNFSGGAMPPMSYNLPPNPFGGGGSQTPPLASDIGGAPGMDYPQGIPPPLGAGETVQPPDVVNPDELPGATPTDPNAPPDQPPSNIPTPQFTPPGQPGLYAGGIPPPNTWGAPTNWPNLGRQLSGIASGVGNFFGNAILDPSVGYYTPDYLSSMGYTSPFGAGYSGTGIPIPGNASAGAVALGLGPLPGATLGYGGLSSLGSSAAQNALFHNIWGGRHPLPYNIWSAGAGTDQSWASMPGGTYQNYLNLWANLPNRGAIPQAGAGAGSGGGPGGAGRPIASPT